MLYLGCFAPDKASDPWTLLQSRQVFVESMLVMPPDPALLLDADEDTRNQAALHAQTVCFLGRMLVQTRGFLPENVPALDAEVRREHRDTGVPHAFC
jgi:hypothetical protein